MLLNSPFSIDFCHVILSAFVFQTVEQRQRAEKLKQRRLNAKEDRLRKIKLRKLGGAPETEAEKMHDDEEDADDDMPESIEAFLNRARHGT